MNNVRVTVNPESGKILIGSLYGSLQPAFEMAVTFLNDSANKNRDIEFYCDSGVTTVVEFPAGARKAAYTPDDVWDLVCKQRADNAAAWRRNNPPPSP